MKFQDHKNIIDNIIKIICLFLILLIFFVYFNSIQ